MSRRTQFTQFENDKQMDASAAYHDVFVAKRAHEDFTWESAEEATMALSAMISELRQLNKTLAKICDNMSKH